MADVKISALPALTSAALTDLFAVVQGGVTYKGTLTQLVAAIPDATGSTRGLLASADWTTFNSKQAGATNLTSLSGLTFASTSFVKMTAAGTFGLDTNTYLTAAITSLGGLTGATQTLGTGTSGTDFAIVSSGTSHTFNLPTASATNRGALSSADWSTFNGKLSAAITSLGTSGNGQTGATQTLAVGTTGTDFAIVSSSNSHTFNLPDASASARGLVTTGTQTFAGNKTFTGDSSTVGNAFIVNNLGGTAKFTVANAGRVSLTSDTTVTTQTVSVITTDTTNAGLVLRPNGTGAIMAQAPDGTSTGGNARGQYAVDFQMVRTANTQVASGSNSFNIGRNNRASGPDSFCGGINSVATTDRSFAFGQNVSSTDEAVAFGIFSIAASSGSFVSGLYARAYLYAQRANASGQFAATGDAQTSAITLRRAITGTAQTELFLDGSSLRAILNISSPGPTNARAWRAQIDLVAIVQTVGNGTVTLGDCFMGSYHVGIKRIGTATSLVGTVDVANEVNDAGMAGAAVTITADDGNEALKIEFTPATNAGSTTVTRVVATAYLTEVGY